MSHFYANPLSIILGFLDNPRRMKAVLSNEHVEAVRNVPSFRKFVESKFSTKDVGEIRKLLTDDDHVRSVVATAAEGACSYGARVGQALTVLEIGRNCTATQNRIPRYELYAKALSGELQGSPLVREFLLSLKKMNSSSLLNLMDKVIREAKVPDLVEQVTPVQQKILELVEAAGASGKKNLTSEFDISNSTLRGTAVSKKVRLGEQKSSLTKHDTEYSALVQEVHNIAERYLEANLKGLQDLFLHELFFYDLISPHRDVCSPR